MSALGRIARSNLLGLGISLGKTADPQAIQRFLDTVRPIETEHPLIRLGGDGDGGYLVPDDLEGIRACFSPGVSTVARFEVDLAARGIKCFLADASVSAPPVQNALFDFEPKYLGPTSADKFITLDDWVDSKAPGQSDFLLQMDIEGAEYGVLLSTDRETLRKFRIVVIEFHGLPRLYDRTGLELISLAFAKLLRDFDPVHIHPNNNGQIARFREFEIPRLLEFTFLRKDRSRSRKAATAFPHHLDRKNVPQKPELVLPSCWYRSK
jgi:hypothetical protein